ncbi:MAG: ABC transporter ATP-binding protein [Alphaproteobacteria bacterium]|nr:MAG: ABC transporter ATP-binding protein [Alphaproteobacteria bacterium]
MSFVSLNNIVKRFGAVTAVHRMSVEIPQGSFVTLLGPSGCGKTTTLRMIAGLLDPSEGDIVIDGQKINDIPIHKRNLGIVFQNYALFPHKTIAQNVAFGLKYRDVSKDEAAKRVRDALELVQLPDVGDRYPAQLSGGQQQRIALARAIVVEPSVLLLDEPLSALDANLREDMRIELKRIQHQTGITTIFVTHDQSEALAMSDMVIVMSKGRVEQIGPPEEVYNRPQSEFIASFLGTSNLLDVASAARENGAIRLDVPPLGSLALPEANAPAEGAENLKLVLRAEKIHLLPADAPADNRFAVEGTVETVDYQGQAARYFLRIGDTQFQAINMIDKSPFSEGEKVSVRFQGEDCVCIAGDAA